MHAALLRSEYYDGSALPVVFSRRCAYPDTRAGCLRAGNHRRTVPVFTADRLPKEASDFVPAISP
jgi:hypothetical protein